MGSRRAARRSRSPRSAATSRSARAGGARFLTGDVDEVEVSKTARSADWIKASARGQGMDANLVIYGADGQREGGGQIPTSSTIAKNLTIDGWVVIGICMACWSIALIIMVFKAIFLSRVERANVQVPAAISAG